MFELLFFTAGTIFLIGLAYKVSNWFRRRIGSSGSPAGATGAPRTGGGGGFTPGDILGNIGRSIFGDSGGAGMRSAGQGASTTFGALAAMAIHNVVKHLLAGAKAVQVCSALYKNGVEYIGTMLGELSEWMDRRGYDSIEAFRGKLSQEKSENPAAYARVQFMKFSVGIE